MWFVWWLRFTQRTYSKNDACRSETSHSTYEDGRYFLRRYYYCYHDGNIISIISILYNVYRMEDSPLPSEKKQAEKDLKNSIKFILFIFGIIIIAAILL